MRRLVAPIAMPILRFATRSYISGPHIADAMEIAQLAEDQGFASTLCYWGESLEDPHEVLDHYLRSLTACVASELNADLAVKIPALWNSHDHVARVVNLAREHRRTVMFDSHDPAASDTTFAFMEALSADYLGCAIPGRWRRSIADADRAIELGICVRVVKGQWADPDAPDIDLRQGFLSIVDRLAGRARNVRIATHDAKLAAESVRRLQEKATPCELELLYGLPIRAVADVAQRAGVPVRIYIPYGTAWLPYSVSRAMGNPRTLLWLMRDVLKGRDKTLAKVRR